MAESEESVKKSVDNFVLALQNVDPKTSEKAVQELVNMGEKVIPVLVSYLKEQEQLQSELNYLEKLTGRAYWICRSSFREKYGHPANEYKNPKFAIYKKRKNAIVGILKALRLLGVKDKFPNLEDIIKC